MIPDPFLDSPRRQRGCLSIFTAAVLILEALAFAVARWGIGDTIAAIVWLTFFGTIAAVARSDARRHARHRIDPTRHPSAGRTHVRIIDRETRP